MLLENKNAVRRDPYARARSETRSSRAGCYTLVPRYGLPEWLEEVR